MRSIFPSLSLLAATLLALLPPPASAFSSDRIWLAAPATNNWNDNNNWVGGNAPDTPIEGATFATSAVLNPTFNANTNFGAGTSGFGIDFQPGANAYLIEINGFTVQINGGINNASSITQTISNGVTNGQLTLNSGSIVGPVTIINSGAGTTTSFISTIQGGIVRLINANPTAVLSFSGVTNPGITVGSIEGGGSVLLGATALSVGSNNLDTIFSGVISDGPASGGSLLKVGTGSLTLTGVNIYTGNTTVSSGALFVQGSIASPQTLVNPGALLGGTGLIGGNVFSHGTVSPGMSPGKLTINGNYRQFSDATLRIEIAGRNMGQFDQLAVQGSASLDGTLQIVQIGKPKLKRGDRLEVVTAGAGVSGTFRDVESNFATGTILTLNVVYEPNAVVLDTEQGSFKKFAQASGLSPNQLAVAKVLDRAAGDPRADKLFNFLDSRNLHDIPSDLNKIAPEELTSIFAISRALADVHAQNIQRNNDVIRSGSSSGFSAANLAINGDGPSYSGPVTFRTGMAGPTGNEDKESKEIKTVAPTENRWSVFLSGTGEWVSVGNTDNARGYDLNSGGFTLGVDYKVSSNFALGLMTGYTGTTADLTDRGRVWVNGGKIGLYATTFAGGWYADMAVFGGYNSYDTRRSALQGEARGDTDGGELNALFGTGYEFKKGGLTFGPTASFNYTYLGTNGFTEHGSLAPLDIHGGKGESLRTALGLKASYDWKVGGVLIKPEIRAAWQHEFGDAAYALDSSFANGAGNSFLINGPQLGRDSTLLGAGFAIQCNERMSTYFYYDGELRRKNYQSTSVTGGVRAAF